MKPSETAALTAIVQALCPGQKIEQNSWRAWHVVLGDLSYTDCEAAVRLIYRERDRDEFGYRRIEPDDILREVRAVRARRIDAAGDALLPPSDLSPFAAIQWQRRATAAAAAGEPVPDNGRGELMARDMRALTQHPQRSIIDA